MRLANDPAIYWYDLENDKILITCDDDLKFFIDESKILKLIFEFEKVEPSRKRTSSILTVDDFSDSSKRLRRKMERIDLSSDSSIDLSSESEDEKVENHKDEIEQEAEKVQTIGNAPKVRIISIDIIKPAERMNQNNSESSVSHVENVTESTINVIEDFPQPSSSNDSSTNINAEKINESVEDKKKQRKQSDSNRIVISDSSDNEDNNDNDQNRRFSDGNYSSAYSFADVNGERFESRASFDDDFRRYRNRRRRDEFDENARRTYRNCSDNMRRMFQQANVARAQAQAASDQAMRNLRSSTNFLPDLLSTFQSHFRPLFQTNSPFNQNFNRP